MIFLEKSTEFRRAKLKSIRIETIHKIKNRKELQLGSELLTGQ